MRRTTKQSPSAGIATSIAVILLSAIFLACAIPKQTKEIDSGELQASIAALTLVETKLKKPIGHLEDGDKIHLSEEILRNLTITATPTTGQIGSIVFILNGHIVQTINEAPYAVAGAESGELFSMSWPAGEYELSAIPYSGVNGAGVAGDALMVSFTIFAPGATKTIKTAATETNQ